MTDAVKQINDIGNLENMDVRQKCREVNLRVKLLKSIHYDDGREMIVGYPAGAGSRL